MVTARSDSEDPIDIEWSDRKLAKAQATERTGRRLLGERWTPFTRRISSLEAADTLVELRRLPGGFHPLGADKAGEWAASLSANWRLVFEPAEDPLPILDGGGLDPGRVQRVRVLRVEDYHGR